DVTEDIYGDFRTSVGHVDMINGAIKGSVGVHVTAGFLDLLVDAAAGAGGRAFKKHVFENMRKACAEPIAFVHAAGHAPGLGGNDRRAMVFARDNRQTIVERRRSNPWG